MWSKHRVLDVYFSQITHRTSKENVVTIDKCGSHLCPVFVTFLSQDLPIDRITCPQMQILRPKFIHKPRFIRYLAGHRHYVGAWRQLRHRFPTQKNKIVRKPANCAKQNGMDMNFFSFFVLVVYVGRAWGASQFLCVYLIRKEGRAVGCFSRLRTHGLHCQVGSIFLAVGICKSSYNNFRPGQNQFGACGGSQRNQRTGDRIKQTIDDFIIIISQ